MGRYALMGFNHFWCSALNFSGHFILLPFIDAEITPVHSILYADEMWSDIGIVMCKVP